MKQLSALNLPIIVISNQAAVGKGLLNPQMLRDITAQMQQALSADGTILTAAYYCIHRAEENCPCRKPKAALLYGAAADFNVDLSRSVFIGDSESDVQAAKAAGCKPVLFAPGPLDGCGFSELMTGVPVAASVTELVDVATKCLGD